MPTIEFLENCTSDPRFESKSVKSTRVTNSYLFALNYSGFKTESLEFWKFPESQVNWNDWSP